MPSGTYIRTPEFRAKMSTAMSRPDMRARFAEAKIAEKNPNWRGSDVGLSGVHQWVKRRLSRPPHYLRELSDWEWLCRRCHMNTDGRLAAIRQQIAEINAARPPKRVVIRRGEQTHCKRGHPLSEARVHADGSRHCRICQRDNARRLRAKARG